MKRLIRLIQILFSIYAFLVFILIMLALFPFILLASFFGKITGGNVIYKICTLWADLAILCWGIRHKNYFKEEYDFSKPAIYVFNHISFVDIPILLKTFRHINIRILGKAEMTKIPVFGYIYKSAAVTVDRSSAANRARSVQVLTSVLKKNISIVLAPEGTFNTTHLPLKEFYDGAFKIALETNTVIRPLILLDTYDRLNYRSVFSLTPGKSRTIFLEEIPVNNFTIDDVQLLKKLVYHKMEEAIINANATWINKDLNA